MKVYHLLAGNLRHITPQIIKTLVVTEHTISKDPSIEHFYCVKMYGRKMLYDNVEQNPYQAVFESLQCKNYKLYYSHKELVHFLRKVSSKDKIIVHGLPKAKEFAFASISLMLFNPKLLKRCTALCWGSDYRVKPTNLIKKLFNQYMKHILSRFKYVLAISTEDEAEIKKFIPMANVVYTPYMTEDKRQLVDKTPREDSKTVVMVSHSGWPHNYHIHTFNLLKKYAGRIKVVCPLCYGDAVYIQNVVDEGKKLFGNDFSYFTELKTPEEYQEFLRTTDIYVTSAEIQTGLGAISLSMISGSKVFAKGNVYTSLTEDHFHIFNTETIAGLDYDNFVRPLTREQALENIEIFNKLHYDGSEIIEAWRKVYEY